MMMMMMRIMMTRSKDEKHKRWKAGITSIIFNSINEPNTWTEQEHEQKLEKIRKSNQWPPLGCWWPSLESLHTNTNSTFTSPNQQHRWRWVVSRRISEMLMACFQHESQVILKKYKQNKWNLWVENSFTFHFSMLPSHDSIQYHQ